MAVAVRLLFFMGLEISEYGGFFSVRSLLVPCFFSVRSRFVLLMLCFVFTAFLAALFVLSPISSESDKVRSCGELRVHHSEIIFRRR